MKPWIRLWRRESSRFRSMPLAARTVASYVLKFVDEGGTLPLGSRDAVTAVALTVGAAPSERRWLKPAVEALVAHGYFEARDGLLVIGNFPRYQDDGATPARRSFDVRQTIAEQSRDADTTLTERSHDANPTLARREIPVSARKDTLAQNVLSSEKREIEKEREKERAQAQHDSRLSFETVRDTFAKMRQAHCGATFRPTQREYTKVNDLMDAANACGDDHASRLSALTDAIRGYLASTDEWCVKRDWPIAGMHDFGACLKRGRASTFSASAHLSPLAAAHHEAQEAVRAARARRDDPEEIYRLEQIEAAAMRAMLEPTRRPS